MVPERFLKQPSRDLVSSAPDMVCTAWRLGLPAKEASLSPRPRPRFILGFSAPRDLDPASCWSSLSPVPAGRASQCPRSRDPADSSPLPPRGATPKPVLCQLRGLLDARPLSAARWSSRLWPGELISSSRPLRLGRRRREQSLPCLPRGHWGPRTGCPGKGHSPSPCMAQAVSCSNLQLRTSRPRERPAGPHIWVSWTQLLMPAPATSPKLGPAAPKPEGRAGTLLALLGLLLALLPEKGFDVFHFLKLVGICLSQGAFASLPRDSGTCLTCWAPGDQGGRGGRVIPMRAPGPSPTLLMAAV